MNYLDVSMAFFILQLMITFVSDKAKEFKSCYKFFCIRKMFP